MDLFQNILVPTAALGGIGAVIDFYLGAAGQKRVKAWLEDKWYRFHDVNWYNFSEKEAQAYIDILDRVFGASLSSTRRTIFTLLSVVLMTIAIFVVMYLRGMITSTANPFATIDTLLFWTITFMIDCAAFSVSLSLARSISLLVVRLSRVHASGWPFVLLVVFHYALLVVWRPIADASLAFLRFAFIGSIVDVYWIPTANVLERFKHLSVWPNEIASEYYRALNPVASPFWPNYLVDARASLTSLFANLIRLLFAFTLLSLFVVRAWFGPIFSTTWARFVESDKPIFTLAFGAIGAIATSLKEILKLA